MYKRQYNPDGSYAYDPDMTVNTGNTDVLDFNFLEERARTEYTLKTLSLIHISPIRAFAPDRFSGKHLNFIIASCGFYRFAR